LLSMKHDLVELVV